MCREPVNNQRQDDTSKRNSQQRFVKGQAKEVEIERLMEDRVAVLSAGRQAQTTEIADHRPVVHCRVSHDDGQQHQYGRRCPVHVSTVQKSEERCFRGPPHSCFVGDPEHHEEQDNGRNHRNCRIQPEIEPGLFLTEVLPPFVVDQQVGEKPGEQKQNDNSKEQRNASDASAALPFAEKGVSHASRKRKQVLHVFVRAKSEYIEL